jgi:hypothetical protein
VWEPVGTFGIDPWKDNDRVKDGAIYIVDIKCLETWAIVVGIMGTHAPHRISYRLLMLIERILIGTCYGWENMLLAVLKCQITSC